MWACYLEKVGTAGCPDHWDSWPSECALKIYVTDSPDITGALPILTAARVRGQVVAKSGPQSDGLAVSRKK
jgi:hypothetical protein